jgi:hypothetical protein
MAKPKLSSIVSRIRLDPRIHEITKEIARQEDRTFADQVQYILRAWLVGNGHLETLD